jgi:hypothetical protein
MSLEELGPTGIGERRDAVDRYSGCQLRPCIWTGGLPCHQRRLALSSQQVQLAQNRTLHHVG